MRLTPEEVIEKYKDRLFSIAFNICQNPTDADDIVQDTFIKYFTLKKEFDNEAHIKAWLIRVTINRSKDVSTSFWRKNKVAWEDYMETLVFEEPEDGRLFEAVMQLPEKYRIVIHLFYYEDYSVREIAELLKRRENTVKSQLARGRMFLKDMLKEEWDDE